EPWRGWPGRRCRRGRGGRESQQVARSGRAAVMPTAASPVRLTLLIALRGSVRLQIRDRVDLPDLRRLRSVGPDLTRNMPAVEEQSPCDEDAQRRVLRLVVAGAGLVAEQVHELTSCLHERRDIDAAGR